MILGNFYDPVYSNSYELHKPVLDIDGGLKETNSTQGVSFKKCHSYHYSVMTQLVY